MLVSKKARLAGGVLRGLERLTRPRHERPPFLIVADPADEELPDDRVHAGVLVDRLDARLAQQAVVPCERHVGHAALSLRRARHVAHR
jgi:hypothetical protein